MTSTKFTVELLTGNEETRDCISKAIEDALKLDPSELIVREVIDES